MTYLAFFSFRTAAFLLGLALVVRTVAAVVRTYVVPRGLPDSMSRIVFVAIRGVFNLRLKRTSNYLERDSILAHFAPVGMLALPPALLAFVLAGYTAMFWAVGSGSWQAAFTMSGSSLFTLGFAQPGNLAEQLLAFSEALIGLVLVAVLIAYLPSIYSAFSRREAAVALLEVRAGSPPSAVEMLLRFQRLGRMGKLSAMWFDWENWFVDIEESHTSIGSLAFFRSPQPDRSWVTAAGAVLDAASLYQSTVDLPDDPQAALCIRAGYIALRRIADFFNLPYVNNPTKDDPVSVTRAEFDTAYEALAAGKVPLVADRDQAWRDFVGWRVNYDTALLGLAALTMAPDAPWSGDRAAVYKRPHR